MATELDNELFELCKEVYKRFPEWSGMLEWFVKTGPKSKWAQTFGPISSMLDGNIPIYTSDYILEKLPNTITVNEHVYWLMLEQDMTEWWIASYQCKYADNDNDLKSQDDYKLLTADTLLKALLRLVIALNDAGELNQQGTQDSHE